MKSYSHWGMFHCWEAPSLDEQARSLLGGLTVGLPPMAEQPKSWMHVDIGRPIGHDYPSYPVTNFTLAEALTPNSNPAQIATYWPHEDDLKLTIVKT